MVMECLKYLGTTSVELPKTFNLMTFNPAYIKSNNCTFFLSPVLPDELSLIIKDLKLTMLEIDYIPVYIIK